MRTDRPTGGSDAWVPLLVGLAVVFALFHALQGAIKILEVPGDQALPLVWMVACAIVPSGAFLFRRPVFAPASSPNRRTA